MLLAVRLLNPVVGKKSTKINVGNENNQGAGKKQGVQQTQNSNRSGVEITPKSLKGDSNGNQKPIETANKTYIYPLGAKVASLRDQVRKALGIAPPPIPQKATVTNKTAANTAIQDAREIHNVRKSRQNAKESINSEIKKSLEEPFEEYGVKQLKDIKDRKDRKDIADLYLGTNPEILKHSKEIYDTNLIRADREYISWSEEENLARQLIAKYKAEANPLILDAISQDKNQSIALVKELRKLDPRSIQDAESMAIITGNGDAQKAEELKGLGVLPEYEDGYIRQIGAPLEKVDGKLSSEGDSAMIQESQATPLPKEAITKDILKGVELSDANVRHIRSILIVLVKKLFLLFLSHH